MRHNVNEGSKTEVTVTSKLHCTLYTQEQKCDKKEQRNRKEKRMLTAASIGGAGRDPNWKTVLRHGGALAREAESEGGR